MQKTDLKKKKKKKKKPGKGAARAGKGFTLFISNEDMNNVIKIIKPLEDSNVLIDSITETVKHKIKKLVQPVISFLVKVIIGRKVRRARRRYMDKNFWFHSIFSAILRLLNVSITSLDLMAFFQEIIYLRYKMERMS